MRMSEIADPRSPRMGTLGVERVWRAAFGEQLCQILNNVSFDQLGILTGHESDGKFSNHLTRDDRFLAGFTKGAFDA